ncbi:MAG: acyl carrier protein [Oscillospiraceae bacterium]|nr:acyl carrier protein [Oscillospiraceae bacterium]
MLEKFKEIICNYVDVDADTITEDSRFIEDLGMNSYDFMCLIGELEAAMDVQVEEQDVVNLSTVGDAIKYIESLQN